MKQIRLIGTRLLTLGLSGLMLISCGGRKKEVAVVAEKHAVAEKVAVMTVEKREAGRTIEYPCTLNPFEDNYLAPASPGRIEKIFVEIGSRVAKGQIIAQMDRTQLIQAEIQLATLQLDYDRFDTLAKLGSVARQRYEQLKGQYDAAKTNVAFLKENTQLLAPFAGTVSEKFFENGELYSGSPNSPAGKAAIVHLIRTDDLKALVGVPEKYLLAVKQGSKVGVRTEVYGNEMFEGSVYRIYPTIDPSSHTFQAEIKIPNAKNLLRPGMYAHISLELSKDEALTVPATAVLKLQGSNERYVFIVENGKAKRVSTLLDRRFDDYVEIVADGIKEGDKIVVKGQARLSDGAEVEIVAD